MKKEISVVAQVFLCKTILGLLWLVVGITHMFNTFVFNIIHLASLLCALLLLVVFVKAGLDSKLEAYDEMSDYHLMKAKATTHDVLHYVFCLGAIIFSLAWSFLKMPNIPWHRIVPGSFFLLMGLRDLITGITFRRLEAE